MTLFIFSGGWSSTPQRNKTEEWWWKWRIIYTGPQQARRLHLLFRSSSHWSPMDRWRRFLHSHARCRPSQAQCRSRVMRSDQVEPCSSLSLSLCFVIDSCSVVQNEEEGNLLNPFHSMLLWLNEWIMAHKESQTFRSRIAIHSAARCRRTSTARKLIDIWITFLPQTRPNRRCLVRQ